MFEAEIALQSKSIISTSHSKDFLNFSMALPKQQFSGDMDVLDEKVETMMIQGENMLRSGPTEMRPAYVCQVCGKEGRKHVI